MRHSGFQVGLCDLTAGEMGSNGTVEERLKEAEAARAGPRRLVARESPPAGPPIWAPTRLTPMP